MIEVELPDGQIAEFPDTMTAEQIQAVLQKQFGSQSGQAEQPQLAQTPESQERPMAASFGALGASLGRSTRKAAEQSVVNAKKRLDELDQTNPYLAALIRDMNPAQRALVGAGAGFKELGAGIGLADIDESERANIDLLNEVSPAAQTGRFVAQTAPFVAGGVGLGLATKGAPLLAQAATQGALGATEGNIISRGTGGTGEEILGATVGGLLIGAGAEVLTPIVKRQASKLVAKTTGTPPKGKLIDNSGGPTPELKKALDETSQTFDEFVDKAKQDDESIKSIVGAGRSGSESSARVAQNVVSDSINLDTVQSAERLGLDAPLGVISDDRATQELAGILSAVPSSQSSAVLNEFTEEFGRRADTYIEELGGSIDRGAVDQNLFSAMQSDIKRIKALEKTLYNRIESDIGEETLVNAKQIKNKISANARRLQGVKNLSPVEKDVLGRIKDNKLTYASLNDLISNVGAAIGRETDAYSTVKKSKLSEVYSDLSRLREGVAETFGHATDIKRAKKIGAARFGLQESTQSLFGKDLQASIFPKIDKAVKGLEKGSVREFRASMELIPDKFRKPVAATMLNTALTGGRNQSLGVNSGQFAKWYKNLSRNESAMRELKKYVGDDAMKRLNDIANVAQGVANVTGSRVRTGVTTEALKRLDDIDGIAGKIYGFSQQAQQTPVARVPAAFIGNATKTITMSKTPAKEAAEELMGSKKFVDAVKEAARTGTNERKFKRLNSQLKQTKEYKNYIKTRDESTASKIASAGLIGWLASDKDED